MIYHCIKQIDPIHLKQTNKKALVINTKVENRQQTFKKVMFTLVQKAETNKTTLRAKQNGKPEWLYKYLSIKC